MSGGSGSSGTAPMRNAIGANGGWGQANAWGGGGGAVPEPMQRPNAGPSGAPNGAIPEGMTPINAPRAGGGGAVPEPLQPPNAGPAGGWQQGQGGWQGMPQGPYGGMPNMSLPGMQGFNFGYRGGNPMMGGGGGLGK